MFMEIKQYTETSADSLGRDLCKTTRTIYLLNGQVPDEKILHPKTQELYKKIYNLQEEKSKESGYPVTIFELPIFNQNFIKEQL